MPLPITDQPWPPKQLHRISPKLREWSAWWTGKPDELAAVYRSGTANTGPKDRPSQMRGGVVGTLARWWWGRPVSPGTQAPDRTHVPLAADIARASGDLLFSEPLTVKVDSTETQQRLDSILAEETYSTLAAAAELSAAQGGVYLQAVADADVAEHAFLTTRTADRAVPEFTHGRLRAVTFWEVLADDGRTVWRHLERHELVEGVGLVQHGLYEGTPTQLGRLRALTDMPEVEDYAELVDQDGYIIAGRTPGLSVSYVPNTDPAIAKAWHDVPGARGWGAPDIDGLEKRLDDLDEVHASWMRDIRLGKARILLAKYMLDDLGPGLGAGFDLDREVFAPLKMAAAEDGDAPITPHQFTIRYAEHQATAREISDEIVQSAGYSAQTFGRQGDGATQTATEVDARESRTMTTRGAKIRLWTPALRRALAKLVTVDAEVFGQGGDPAGLRVEFADGVQEQPLVLAQTAQALRVAQAASTQTLVQLVHPDWGDTEVAKEAERIIAETPSPLADPFSFQG